MTDDEEYSNKAKTIKDILNSSTKGEVMRLLYIFIPETPFNDHVTSYEELKKMLPIKQIEGDSKSSITLLTDLGFACFHEVESRIEKKSIRLDEIEEQIKQLKTPDLMDKDLHLTDDENILIDRLMKLWRQLPSAAREYDEEEMTRLVREITKVQKLLPKLWNQKDQP